MSSTLPMPTEYSPTSSAGSPWSEFSLSAPCHPLQHFPPIRAPASRPTRRSVHTPCTMMSRMIFPSFSTYWLAQTSLSTVAFPSPPGWNYGSFFRTPIPSYVSIIIPLNSPCRLPNITSSRVHLFHSMTFLKSGSALQHRPSKLTSHQVAYYCAMDQQQFSAHANPTLHRRYQVIWWLPWRDYLHC